MNVFIRIFDIQKELSGKEYDVLKKVTDFPQLLEKLIAKNPEKLMQYNFYVEFYSISDEGKFEKLYSSYLVLSGENMIICWKK